MIAGRHSPRRVGSEYAFSIRDEPQALSLPNDKCPRTKGSIGPFGAVNLAVLIDDEFRIVRPNPHVSLYFRAVGLRID